MSAYLYVVVEGGLEDDGVVFAGREAVEGVDGLAGHGVAAHNVVVFQFLPFLEPRGIVEHIGHPSQGEGVLLHHGHDVCFLPHRQVGGVLEHHVEEALYDVQRRAYLV